MGQVKDGPSERFRFRLHPPLKVDGADEFAYYLAAVGPAPQKPTPNPATR